MRAVHQLTVGQTESGKSLYNQWMAKQYKAQGIKIGVLDPYKDPAWFADFITDDPAEFLSIVRNVRIALQCALFIDEGGTTIGRYAEQMEWTTCQARHHGHVTHISCQRAEQVSRTVRSQCSILNCFNVNPKDAKIYAEDFNCAMVEERAPFLAQGEFIRVRRFMPPEVRRIF